MKFRLLKNKDYLRLMLGKLASLLGSNMVQFSLSLYVLALTGSALIFASMLSISILPRLLLSPIAGVFGDWFDRKKMIVMLDFLTAFIIAFFGALFFINGGLNLILIYVFVIILEMIEIFFGSAMAAVIPSMVKKEDLLEANSLQSLVMNFGQLLAPMIASVIYGFFGMQIILLVTPLCFALSAISEMFINIPKVTRKTMFNLTNFKTDFVEGVKIIQNDQFILTIVGLVAIINFTISPLFSVGITFVLKEILKVSDFQFGLFQSIFAIAAMCAPLLLAFRKNRQDVGSLLYMGFLFLGMAVLVLAFIPSTGLLKFFGSNLVPYLLLLIIFFVVGLLVTIVNITMSTIFAQIVPLDAMSRASSVLTLAATVLIPVGQVIFGLLFDHLAATYVIMICGVILTTAVLIYRKRLLNIATHLKKESNHEVLVSA